jgi:AraC-like DNA-binding protein
MREQLDLLTNLGLRMESPTINTPALQCLNTSGVTPADRIDLWRGIVRDRIIPLDLDVLGHKTLDASLRWLRLGAISVSMVHATPHAVRRTAPMINLAGADSLILNLMRDGCGQAEQDGRQARMRAGGGVLCNGARPYVLEFPCPFEIVVVQLPREMLSRSLAGLDFGVARELETSPLYSVVTSYACQLLDRPPEVDPATSERLANNFADLISLLVGDVVQASHPPISEYKAATLTRIRQFVEAHLSDPELSPERVAAELRLSARYINALLQAEGTSLSRMIWSRRLERVARDLRDPALQSRTISCIAFHHGFNDLTHFSKAFRQKFGLAPRDFRQAEVTAKAGPEVSLHA